MPRANLPVSGDNIYTEKVKRIQKLTTETEEKIDWIPGLTSSLDSTSTTDALSAAAGKLLQDQINELKSRGRFLSTWDCTTWLPDTDPVENPHYYATWDYYIINNVAWEWWTNYRPHWDRYTAGVASTTVETRYVKKNDQYLYDWQSWVLLSQNEIELIIDSALSSSSTNAVENRVVTNALNTKQNTISDLATIRANANKWATAIQPWDNISELTNNSWFQTAWDVANAIAGKANTSDLIALTTRVSTAEWTIASQWQAITDLQQSQGWSASDISDLQWDVSNLQTDVTNLQTALAWKVDSSDLSTVATSGKASDLDNDAWFVTQSYIGNWQITLTQWWVNKGSFTLNQSWAANIALERTNIISQAEYSSLTTPDANTTYLITDWTPASAAQFVTFPTTEEMNQAIADAVSDAIADVDEEISGIEQSLSTVDSRINSAIQSAIVWEIQTAIDTSVSAAVSSATFTDYLNYCKSYWSVHTSWSSWYTMQWYWWVVSSYSNAYQNDSYIYINWTSVWHVWQQSTLWGAWWSWPYTLKPWDTVSWSYCACIVYDYY